MWAKIECATTRYAVLSPRTKEIRVCQPHETQSPHILSDTSRLMSPVDKLCAVFQRHQSGDRRSDSSSSKQTKTAKTAKTGVNDFAVNTSDSRPKHRSLSEIFRGGFRYSQKQQGRKCPCQPVTPHDLHRNTCTAIALRSVDSTKDRPHYVRTTTGIKHGHLKLDNRDHGSANPKETKRQVLAEELLGLEGRMRPRGRVVKWVGSDEVDHCRFSSIDESPEFEREQAVLP